jgi:hypothetical protein
MLDVALHILGAAIMMSPVFLATTPWPLAFPWAVLVSLFWFARELAQDRQKHGYWRSLSEWSGWKWAEGLAPCVTALACAAGITFWRGI